MSAAAHRYANRLRRRQEAARQGFFSSPGVLHASGLSPRELRAVAHFLATHLVLPSYPWGAAPAGDDAVGLGLYARSIFDHFVAADIRGRAIRGHSPLTARLAIDWVTATLPENHRGRYVEELHSELFALTVNGMSHRDRARYLIRQAWSMRRTRRELRTVHVFGDRP